MKEMKVFLKKRNDQQQGLKGKSKFYRGRYQNGLKSEPIVFDRNNLTNCLNKNSFKATLGLILRGYISFNP